MAPVKAVASGSSGADYEGQLRKSIGHPHDRGAKPSADSGTATRRGRSDSVRSLFNPHRGRSYSPAPRQEDGTQPDRSSMDIGRIEERPVTKRLILIILVVGR